eukprot:5697382-Karenia_brevis.AAC.1
MQVAEDRVLSCGRSVAERHIKPRESRFEQYESPDTGGAAGSSGGAAVSSLQPGASRLPKRWGVVILQQ